MKNISKSVYVGFCLMIGMMWGCAYNPEFITVDGGWQQHDSSPVGVIAPAGSYCEVNEKFVVSGGIRADGSESPKVLLFSAKSGGWEKGPNLNLPRFMHTQVRLDDGRVLIIGGRRFDKGKFMPLKSCEILSADHETIELAGTLPMAMHTPTAHVMKNGNVIAIGGGIACIYDVAQNTWDEEGVIDLREKRREHASVLMDDGQVLVIGGTGRKTFELVDPVTKRTKLLSARLPIGLDDTSAVILPDGRVWIIGGQRSSDGNTISETYLLTIDHANGDSRIGNGPRLPHKRGVSDHLMIDVGEAIVLLSGESQYRGADVELKDAYLLDKKTLAIYVLPELNAPHDDAVGFAIENTVYVTGGQVTASEGAYMFLTMPRPVKTTESLTIPRPVQ
ncbi:hypothetical protein JD969_15740 [Planctomycetota bacterium]|nr:hypothetical protein JD969_15740 [Planctomycetota bacterium]